MLNSGSRTPRACRGMCLVHDDEIRRMRKEPVALRFRFDEVDARNEVRVVLVNRDVARWQVAQKAAKMGRLNEYSIDREFLEKRALPLVAEMRGAQHAESATQTAIE